MNINFTTFDKVASYVPGLSAVVNIGEIVYNKQFRS